MGLSYKVDALPQELRAGEFAVVNGSTFVGDENNVPVPVNLNYDLGVVEDYTSWLSSPQVKKTTTLKDSADEIIQVFIGLNTRTPIVHFSGIYNRVYFIYKHTVTSLRVGFYDYDTDAFTILNPSLTLATSDDHGYIAIEVADDGHILLGICGDDSYPMVYRSDNPEDITAFTLMEDAMATASGAVTYANYFSLCKTKKAIVGCARTNLHNRTIFHSLDNGVTWEQAVTFLKLYDDPNHPYGHWAYGSIIPDHNGDGVFIYINVLDDIPPSTYTRKNYPILGILYTKDFINFSNVQHWASDGEQGYSKNVVQNGHITDAEFVENYAFLNGGYDTTANNYFLGIELLPNGGIVVMSSVGTRTNGGGTYPLVITGYRTSIFSLETKTWTHNTYTKPAGVDGDEYNGLKILNRSADGSVFDILILATRTGGFRKWEQWRTADSGATFTYLRDVTNNTTYDIGRMANSYYSVNKKAYFNLLENDGEINLIMYDKSVRP